MGEHAQEAEIAVIGGGSAGSMAYLRGVLNNDKTLFFTGNALAKKRSRGTWVHMVENMPGFFELKNPITKATIDTIKFLEKHPQLSEKSCVVKDSVESIEKDKDGFVLKTPKKGTFRSRYVLVATGIMDVQPIIEGSIEPVFPYANAGHLIYCVRCDGHLTLGETLSVVGNSTDAIYIAKLMIERYDHKHVDVLFHGHEVDVSAEVQALLDSLPITVHPEPIVDILGPTRPAVLEGFALSGGKTIECTKSIISLGILPYNDLLKSLGAELDDSGRVVVGEAHETSVHNVFAAGDLVSGRKMQIYTGWDEAVDALDMINRRIRKAKSAD